MRRIGIGTILSLGMNAFLLFWMVNQYIYDTYFQNFVNATVGPIFPFMVLALGVGGGSGLGYFVLRHRHGGEGASFKVQKPRVFRPITAVASPSSSITSAAPRNVPAGVPPTPTSKHTVYNVPPLPKAAPSTGTRTAPSSSWSAAGKSIGTPFKPENAGRTAPGAASWSDEPKGPSNILSSVPRAEVPLPASNPRAFGDASARPGPSAVWRPEPSTQPERRTESTIQSDKVGIEPRPKQSSAIPGQDVGPSSSTQSAPFQPLKWQPPEQKPSGQWPDNSQRPSSPSPVPSKWIPPPGVPKPQGQQPSLSPVPPRPGAFPPRPPSAQVPPRPFVYQGPRPGEPRPMGAPRPFGPDQNRSPQGTGQFQRPSIAPPQRQNVTGVGPMPQPWSPAQPMEKKEVPGSGPHPDKAADQEMSSSSAELKNSDQVSPGGEMDWDTALDTILKTLRKDRVGDKA